ncbi:helix-turn-helix domain-containing protein [Nonomuraea sp. NPDC050328]|uniref:helix-turn-helix domain-containing protein n=1 Tax=Nonomuraea sp. NPDC050328 TaxID=3364361 RepID=UPI0037B37761
MPEGPRRGRRKKPLVHDGTPVTAFALGLRELRARAGDPPYRTMAEKTHVAANVLSQADAGHRLPTTEALVAYVRACDGDVEEWTVRLTRAQAAQAALDRPELPAPIDQSPPTPEPTNSRPRPRVSARLLLPIGGLVVVAAVAGLLLSGLWPRGVWPRPPAPHPPAPPVTPAAASCRPTWSYMEAAEIFFLPCIERRPEGLLVSALAKPVARGVVEGGVTVWVWPMNLKENLLRSREYHLTRNRFTLRHCLLDFDGGDEIKTCGPFLVRPADQGTLYAASGTADEDHDQVPPGWSSSSFTGTQSPAVEWRAR